MIRINKHSFAVMALVLVAGAALAQGGPMGDGPMGNGPREDRPMTSRTLILDPQIAKELKLTADQVKSLKDAARDHEGGPQGMQGHPRAEGGLKKVLSATQLARYQQIQLQMQGARALLSPKVVIKLQLTESQIDRLEDILAAGAGPAPRDEVRPDGQQGRGFAPEGAMGGEGFGGRQGGPELRGKPVDKQLLAVLTKDQTAKWNQLLGKRLTLKVQGPPQGGPGPDFGGGPQGGPEDMEPFF